MFLIARLSIVLARPGILIVLSWFIGADSAGSLGRLLVAIGIGMIVSAFDSGKIFYESVCDVVPNNRLRELAFEQYTWRLLVTSVVGICVTGALTISWGFDGWATTLACVFFVSERVIDERQRYLLVESRTKDWSMMQLQRGSFQIGLTVIFMIILVPWRVSAPGWFILPLLVANATMLRHGWFIARIRWIKSIAIEIQHARMAVSQIQYNQMLWVSGLLGAMLGYTDKFLIAAWNTQMTAGLLIVCSCLAIQSMMVSVIFFTPRRGAIVRRKLSLRVLLSAAFVLPVLGGLLVASIAAVFAIQALPMEGRPSNVEVALLALLATVSGIGGVIREVIYYRESGLRPVLIDAGGVIAIFVAANILMWIGAPIYAPIGAACFFHAARIVAMCLPPAVTAYQSKPEVNKQITKLE